MDKIRHLRVAGTPYEMGYAHGVAYGDEIAVLTEERLRLSSDPFWTGGLVVTHDDVLALGEACLAAHEAFAPELVEEIRGMADATGLGVNELVIMNGFTDFVDLMANPQSSEHRSRSATKSVMAMAAAARPFLRIRPSPPTAAAMWGRRGTCTRLPRPTCSCSRCSRLRRRPPAASRSPAAWA